MKTQLINFTIPNELLKKVDILARKQAKSRSELLREATRKILSEAIERNDDFERIDNSAKRINFKEDEAIELINQVRSKLPINQ